MRLNPSMGMILGTILKPTTLLNPIPLKPAKASQTKTNKDPPKGEVMNLHGIS